MILKMDGSIPGEGGGTCDGSIVYSWVRARLTSMRRGRVDLFLRNLFDYESFLSWEKVFGAIKFEFEGNRFFSTK